MIEMILFSKFEAKDLMILNSLAGENILRTESLTLDPENQTGLLTGFPSIQIDVIVLETRRISSCVIPNWSFARIFTRWKDSFSTFFIIVSISCMVISLVLSVLTYCVMRISEINVLEEKERIASVGMVSTF